MPDYKTTDPKLVAVLDHFKIQYKNVTFSPASRFTYTYVYSLKLRETILQYQRGGLRLDPKSVLSSYEITLKDQDSIVDSKQHV